MFKEYNQNQVLLLPPRLDDSIEADHIARLINYVIETMDFSFIEKTYSANGQNAYYPKMLLKVLVYGYSSGICSSRKLADKLAEDIVFMWLSGKQTPNFRTISDFRKDKLSDFKKIFTQVLNTCFSLGLTKVGKVSLDGTKILANASRNKAIYRKQLARRKENIKKQIDEIIKEAERLDREEDKFYGNTTINRTGKTFSKEEITNALKQVQKKVKKIKQIKRKQQGLKKKQAQLKARTQDIKEKEKIMRKDRNSYSSTDKDSTVMFMKEGYTAPGYNVQLATEHQIILAYGLFSDRNDNHLLRPMIEEIKEQTKRKPEIIITDAGYGNKKNYRFLKHEQIAGFIPYQTYEQENILRNKGLYDPPKHPDRELERYKFKMRLRLKSEEGKELQKRRREDVEPTIGDIKKNMGFRRFNLRGKYKCEIELGLLSMAHNLKKIGKWLKKSKERDNETQKGLTLETVSSYLPV